MIHAALTNQTNARRHGFIPACVYSLTPAATSLLEQYVALPLHASTHLLHEYVYILKRSYH